MKDWKTTLFGLLALAPQVLQVITPALPPKYANIASAVMAAIAFYNAKDVKKSLDEMRPIGDDKS